MLWGCVVILDLLSREQGQRAHQNLKPFQENERAHRSDRNTHSEA